MAGGIVWTQLQDMLQQSNRILSPVLILDLRRPFQCRQIVGRLLQRVAERSERFLFVSFAGKSNAAQGPQLRILGTLLQRGLQPLQCLVELPRTQRSSNGSDLLRRGLSSEEGTSGERCRQNTQPSGETHTWLLSRLLSTRGSL